jgi:LacI family transcriptional regulator
MYRMACNDRNYVLYFHQFSCKLSEVYPFKTYDSALKPASNIVEVAKAANVSTATVSRVLNDVPGVRLETAQLVRETLEAMRFKRQRARRRHRHDGAGGNRVPARTGNIAVIAVGHSRAWLQMPVMASVVYGIQRACGELGFRLILDDLPDPTKPSPLVESRQIDGAVVFLSSSLSTVVCEQVLSGMRSNVAVVCAMGMELSGQEADRITSDGLAVGSLAYSYLRRRGCRELAFLTADAQYLFVRVRCHAFLDAAYRAGASALVYLVGDDDHLAQLFGRNVVTAANLEALVAKLCRKDPRPDGLFVANDMTTALIYPMLARHGIEVGRDLTIISCDNEEARLSALHPRPESIDLNGDEIGYRAVVRLVWRLQNPNDVPLSIQIPPRLIAQSESAAK